MELNGLPLPAALVQILQDANGETTGWMLKDPDWRKQVNAYGDEFDLGDFMILRYETMVRETADLPGRFDPSREKYYYSNREAKEPSTLPYIRDYSQIVVFGKKGSGEPYCLDYRENPQAPSVFHLPHYGACWMRVAPSSDSFRELIIPLDDDEYDRRIAEEEAEE